MSDKTPLLAAVSTQYLADAFAGSLLNTPQQNIIRQGTEAADNIYLNNSTSGVTVYAKGGNDWVAGSNHADTIYGGNGNDVLDGKAGNDTLHGDDGDDWLSGGDGNDVLNGGSGIDYMFGGNGSDTYYVDHLDDLVDESLYFELSQYGPIQFVQNTIAAGTDTLYVSVSNYKVPTGIEKVVYTNGATALPYFIDALASGSKAGYLDVSKGKWNGTGQSLTVKYSFATSSYDSQTGDWYTGFRQFSEAQKTNVRAALEAYSKVADITFTEVSGSGADFRFYMNDLAEASGNGRKAMNVCPCCRGEHQASDTSGWITTGYAYFGGDVHLNSNIFANNTQAFAYGQDGYDTLLHEIGHSLGLKHPGQYGSDYGPFLSPAEEHLGNTLMTYHTAGHTEDRGLKNFDLAAVHYLFGVNKTARAGNDSYTLASRYIWDGAGNDTLSAAAESQGVYFNLNPGSWIYRGSKAALLTAAGQAFIGLGTYLENAIGSNHADQIYGNHLDNVLSGLAGDDKIWGGLGNDRIYGGDGKDILKGDAGNDTVYGGNGDDTLYGYIGDDSLYGEAGNDALYGEQGNDRIWGGLGNDRIWGGDGNDVLKGDAGNDTVYGGNGNDTLYGYIGDDQLYGEAGNDKLYGEQGNDKIWGGLGNDQLYGGEGNDTLKGDAGEDTIYGGNGHDSLYGYTGNDTLFGEANNDKIWGEQGHDKIWGGLGNDRIWGGDGNDVLKGDAGNDTVYGGNGDDTLYGYIGDDSLYGEAGNDALYGEQGNDKIWGGLGNDRIWGGDGNDVLKGDAGNDTVYGGNGNDTLYGYIGDDLLFGDNGNDVLYGEQGHDKIWGGAGSDTLFGGDGNDILKGDAGNDILWGGAGSDHFVFTAALGSSNVDQVKDFAVGIDKIGLGKAIFGALGSGIEANEFGFGSSATSASQRLVFNQSNGQLLYDADGSGSGAAVHFATLSTGLNQLDHNSFYIA